MSTQTAAPPEKRYRPYVPENMEMKEFTFRAVLIGLFLTVILGAANAYLGLRAGMTIAATYPAAVIGMALLRLMKGSLLEENIARTVGSIGESVAAGAVFTIPAFLDFRRLEFVWISRCVLEVSCLDGGGRIAGHFVRDPASTGHGGRSRTSLPGVGGRIGNSQGRTAGREGSQTAFRQHGPGRIDLSAGRVSVVQRQQSFRHTYRADRKQRC